MPSFLNLIFSILLILVPLYLYVDQLGNHMLNRLFFILILAVSFQNLAVLLNDYDLYQNHPNLTEFETPFIFLIPPLYYFLIKLHFNYKLEFRFRDVLHLIPFLAIVAFLIPFYSSDTGLKEAWIAKTMAGENPVKSIYAALYLTLFIIYIYLSLKYLRNINQKSKDGIGYPYALKKWIRELGYFTLLYFLFSFLPVIINPDPSVNNYVPFLNLLFYGLFLIRIKLNKKNFGNMKYVMKVLQDNDAYGSDPLSDEDIIDIQKMVTDHLGKQNINKEPKISLVHLANQVLIPVHHLNEAITRKPNQAIGKHIY